MTKYFSSWFSTLRVAGPCLSYRWTEALPFMARSGVGCLMARYNVLILNGEPVVPHVIIPQLVTVLCDVPELGLTRGETLRVARCGWFVMPTQACPHGSVWVLLEGEARMPIRLRTPTMPTVLVNPIQLSVLTRAGYLVEVVPASELVAIVG